MGNIEFSMLSCDQAVFFFFRREGKRKKIDREGMVVGYLHFTDLSFFGKLLLVGTVVKVQPMN